MDHFSKGCNFFKHLLENARSRSESILWSQSWIFQNEITEALNSTFTSIIAFQSTGKTLMDGQNHVGSQYLDTVLTNLSKSLDVNFRVYLQIDGSYRCKWYSYNKNKKQIVVTIGVNQFEEYFIPVHIKEKQLDDNASDIQIDINNLPFQCIAQNYVQDTFAQSAQSQNSAGGHNHVQQETQAQTQLNIGALEQFINQTTDVLASCRCQRQNEQYIQTITLLISTCPQLHQSLTKLLLKLQSSNTSQAPPASAIPNNSQVNQEAFQQSQGQAQVQQNPHFCAQHGKQKSHQFNGCSNNHCIDCLFKEVSDRIGKPAIDCFCEHNKKITRRDQSLIYKLMTGTTFELRQNMGGFQPQQQINHGQQMGNQQYFNTGNQNQLQNGYNPGVANTYYHQNPQGQVYGNQGINNQVLIGQQPGIANTNYYQDPQQMTTLNQIPQALANQATNLQNVSQISTQQNPYAYAQGTQQNVNIPQNIQNEQLPSIQNQLPSPLPQQSPPDQQHRVEQNVLNKPSIPRMLQNCIICQNGKDKDEFSIIAHKCDVCNECRVKAYLQTGNNNCPNQNCNTMYGDGDCDMLQILAQIEPQKYGNIQRAPPQEQGELKYCSSCASYKHQNVIQKCSNNRCQLCKACIQQKGRGCQCGGTFQQEVQAPQQNQGGGSNYDQGIPPPRPAQLPQAGGNCMNPGCALSGDKPGRELACGHWIHFGCIENKKCTACGSNAV